MAPNLDEIKSVVARLKRRGEYDTLLREADDVERDAARLLVALADSTELTDAEAEEILLSTRPARVLGREATRVEIAHALSAGSSKAVSEDPKRRRAARPLR